MKIQQISVFLENHPGRLVGVLESLEQAGVSIRALSISDAADFGIVRLVVTDPAKGSEALKKAGFTTRLDWILSAEIPDVPGGLLKTVAQPLAEAGINLRYFYAFIEPGANGKAVVVIKPDDVEKAEKVLGTK